MTFLYLSQMFPDSGYEHNIAVSMLKSSRKTDKVRRMKNESGSRRGQAGKPDGHGPTVPKIRFSASNDLLFYRQDIKLQKNK
ncbi:MAG: hypothetical protein IJH79_16545, partial [Lentisphaeria bacterium]|nr:hypothetical protein [Lentisphaeria bacterium]